MVTQMTVDPGKNAAVAAPYTRFGSCWKFAPRTILGEP